MHLCFAKCVFSGLDTHASCGILCMSCISREHFVHGDGNAAYACSAIIGLTGICES
jgi:hypothetical protein